MLGLCDKLTDLTIYSEKININNSVIYFITALEQIKINQDNNTYKSVNRIVYSKDLSKIYAYSQVKKGDTYVI